MKECRDFWYKHHTQDRYIVVNKNGVLTDGYIQYLILKEQNVKYANVKVSNKTKTKGQRIKGYDYGLTTYVFGVHLNKKTQRCSREYVWRMPHLWTDTGKSKSFAVGNKALVITNRGIKPIKITKIETREDNPVYIKVKKVICK